MGLGGTIPLYYPYYSHVLPTTSRDFPRSWIIPATLAPWRQDNDTLRPDTDGVSGVALFEAVLKVGVEDVGL